MLRNLASKFLIEFQKLDKIGKGILILFIGAPVFLALCCLSIVPFANDDAISETAVSEAPAQEATMPNRSTGIEIEPDSNPTAAPSVTSFPTETNTPVPTNTTIPTNTPNPTNTAHPTNTPRPTNTATFPPPTNTAVSSSPTPILPTTIPPTVIPPTAVPPTLPLPTEPPPPPQPTSPPAPTEQVNVVPGPVVILAVDKRAEVVTIQNQGADISLDGWMLRSEKGNQDCYLGGGLGAGQSLNIWAMSEDAGQGGFNCGFGTNIWNNSERDPAVLYDNNGNEVSRFG